MNDLTQRLRARIAQAGGWLPFDAFMAEALYAPGLGYYSSGRPTFGHGPQSGSDFVTAPELSPLFGQALARQVAQAMAATGVDQLWEFGAGSGALAESVLDALAALGAVPSRYTIVDLSGSLRGRQQERLARFGDQVQWRDTLPEAVEGVLIGNEVLDAMPVKLLHFDGEAWAERGVTGAPDGFAWADRPTDLRPPLDRDDWLPGTVTEVHPQAEAWVRTLGAAWRRGAMFLIDYGFGEQEYYLPARQGGTLMCHHLHQADPDPLTQVGEKDITAHVNFTGIALAAQDVGLTVLGYTTQAHFLLNCGLGDLLAAADLRGRAMAQKLLTEHEMGELFKVIALAPEAQAFDALGFVRGDRSHRL
ncbi:class I SAM-dependent methyltransferase [Inhella gelatinilytica]|nr:SAM-dependent methyltransferase [Inhella gelatinilytica]